MDSASFGYWLKRQRKALDLTQAALAQQIGCAVVTLRKIEANALRPSVQVVQRLAECLQIPPAERAAFLKAARTALIPDRMALPTQRVSSPDEGGMDAPSLMLQVQNLPSGTVTFLLTDIEGSTRRWEQYPHDMEAALARHNDILYVAILSSEGYVFKTVGDAVYAAFASAPKALAAALAAQRALLAEDWGKLGTLPVRMALHTGTAQARGGDYVEPSLNRAACLVAAAHAGQILLSWVTHELVRGALPSEVELLDLGEHRLKDLTRPEHIFQPVAPDLPADFPPLTTLDHRLHNLPVQLTALIGRDREVATVCTLLRRADVRLLTCTGSGGIGKTRLALQAAGELLDDFTDGVFFVALAPISSPTLVVPTIAQALNVRERDGQPLLARLQEELRDRQLLLILDNFEQVAVAAPMIAALLAATARLKILVTSRAVLHLSGEYEYVVSPLTLPDYPHSQPLERLTQYEAVRLFIARAQAVKAEFAVTNANAPAVAEICVRLDGLPLAIELAAARVKLFPPQALLARLDNRLKLLTGGAHDLPARHQTIRGTIDWSYNLLDAGASRLFVRLAVFVGGCMLEAAEAVCNTTGDLSFSVVDGVAALLDQSLVRCEEQPDGESRFVMLETIREYALERLAESGVLEQLRQRHATYYLGLVEQADTFHSAEQARWLGWLETEHDNLRAALEWSLGSGEAEIGLRLVGALWHFWYEHGYLSEGRRWLGRALSRGSDASALRAKVLYGAGYLAWVQSDFTQARALQEQSLALFRALDDKAGTARAQYELGMVALSHADYAQAVVSFEASLALFRNQEDLEGMAFALYGLGTTAVKQGIYSQATVLGQESVALFRRLGIKGAAASALNLLGQAAQLQGDYDRAAALFEESLEPYRELNNKHGLAWALANLGSATWRQGSYDRAAALFREGLTLKWEVGDRDGVAGCLEGLMATSVAQRRAARAARLGGAAETLRAMINAPLPPAAHADYAQSITAARAQLGESVFVVAWAEGRRMPLEQAVAYALSADD
jgi:predicted ATPase/class 3 adenylate cyclase